MDETPIRISRLGARDLAKMRALSAFFGTAFEEKDHYLKSPPPDAYLAGLLAEPGFVALAAMSGERIAGGLVAYELRKFEQVRSEFYIYDLAVAEAFRRRGIATALIQAMKPVAAARGAHILIIQATSDNAAAIAAYGKLGIREDAASFEIKVE